MASRKTPLSNDQDKQKLSQQISDKKLRDKEEQSKDAAFAHYLAVYFERWRKELIQLFPQEEGKLLRASPAELGEWAQVKLDLVETKGALRRQLTEIFRELKHLLGIQQELQSGEMAAEYAQMASLHEEMDYFYTKAEPVYEHLIERVEQELDKLLENYLHDKAHAFGTRKELTRKELYALIHQHRNELEPLLLDSDNLQALVIHFYKSIEKDIVEGTQQINEASQAAKYKNPHEFDIADSDRHVPRWSDAYLVTQKVERYKKFAGDLQIEALKERLSRRLKAILQGV